MSPVRVVVVEDSAVQRAHLISVLEATKEIKVVGQAVDTDGALAAVRSSRPDVVTMDLHLPGAGGVEAIRQVMQASPVPILVLTVSAGEGQPSRLALDALSAGAVEVLPKPSRWTESDQTRLRTTVVALRGARPARPKAPAPLPGATAAAGTVVAVAASTGGPGAIARVLADLAGLRAPVLVVQHIHSDFMANFVSWLGTRSPLLVSAAQDGASPAKGHVYVAPSHFHLRIDPDRRLRLDPRPASLHRPSADELFRPVARSVGPAGIGVLLTGMGDDGAAGLLAMRGAGGQTLCQDEATSTVFGMPRAAQRLGAATCVLALEEIGPRVALAVKGGER